MSTTTITTDPTAEPTLYARLGGTAAIEAAVDDFYRRVLADAELAPHFTGVDVDRLRAHQRAFLTAALGGPAAYHGRSLAEAHRGRGITDDAFAQVVGHLVDTLHGLGVDAGTIGEVVGVLAPTAPLIVTHP